MDIVTRFFDDPIQDGRAVDLMVPDKVTRKTAVLGIHGGGWAAGSRNVYHKILFALAKQGYACASTDYRLAMGKGSLQNKVEDIREGYEIFRSYLAEQGRRKVKQFMFIGSSAGAHLAGLVGLTTPGQLGESTLRLKAKWKAPTAMVLCCGPVTFEPWPEIFPEIHASMNSLIGCAYDDDPQSWRDASFDQYVTEESPRICFYNAANEHIFPNGLTRKAAARWRKRGLQVDMKTYPDAEHGFFYDIQPRKCQKQAFADLCQYLEDIEK